MSKGMRMNTFKAVAVGAGYFSHFQYEAWQRIPEVTVTAFCNRNAERDITLASKAETRQSSLKARLSASTRKYSDVLYDLTRRHCSLSTKS